ncbi:MAG: hypothetical protein ITG02_16470 [Patulibacter sp.]|nr:hypothetical protein [Patulibacter sp.]
MTATIEIGQAATGLAAVQDELRTAAGSVGADASEAFVMRRLRDTFDRAFAALEQNVRLQVPIERRRTFTEVIETLGTLANRGDDDVLTLDEVDGLLTKIEAARHVLRDALDHADERAIADTDELVAQLGDWLPGVTQKELASLLGVQPRTLQRWRSEGGRPLNERQRLVADLVAVLRHGWTPRGVLRWFERPHPELDDAAPVSLLDDEAHAPELRAAAVAGRAMRAT